MQQMPHNHPYLDPRFRMPQYQQVPRPRRWRFRWGIVWVVLTILICVWFLKGVGEISYDSYTRLAALAILGIALTLIVKVSRRK